MIRIALVLLAALAAACPAWAQKTPMTIGVLANRGEAVAEQEWGRTSRYLSDVLPRYEFRITPLSFEAVEPAVKGGLVHFIITNPAIYVDLETKYHIMRIATMRRGFNGRSTSHFGGVIFCRADRLDIATLADLRGKRFAATSPTSLGGWLAALDVLKSAGLAPDKDFKSLTFAKSHDAVVRSVLEGAADAGTIRTDILEEMAHDAVINIKDFRVLTPGGFTPPPGFPFAVSTPLYPEWPFAKLDHTPDELAKRVSAALMTMPADATEHPPWECDWTVPLNYEPVHLLLKNLKLPPYDQDVTVSTYDYIQQNKALAVSVLFSFLGMVCSLIYFRWLNSRLTRTNLHLAKNAKKLVLARKQAEGATKAKSAFLAFMSHEVRTPLNAVLGLASLALREGADGQSRTYFESILSSSRQLMVLINDILDFSKIEAGKLALEDIPFDLGRLINQTVASLAPLAQQKSLYLDKHVSYEVPPCVSGDPTRVAQVLGNLVGNAIKFTSEGGVEVWVRVQDGRLCFEVADTGMGVPPDMVGRIFDSFTQAGEHHARKFGGVGLGLSICKRLVEMMGGTIEYRPRLTGGSIFSFMLPLRECPAELAAQPEPQAEATPETQTTPLRILLAEDDEMSRMLLSRFVTRLGHTATCVENGRKALEALSDAPFDMVLMDGRMPDMDGMEATIALRAGKAGELNRAAPVIAVTAQAMKGDREAFLAAGADAYVSKPVNLDELSAVIAALSKKSAGQAGAAPQAPPLPDRPPPATQAVRQAAGAAPPRWDRDAALGRLQGMASLLRSMDEVFVRTLPEDLAGLREAFLAEDMAQVRAQAHKIKGNAAGVGAQALSELAFELEKAAATEQGHMVASLLPHVLALAEESAEELQKMPS